MNSFIRGIVLVVVLGAIACLTQNENGDENVDPNTLSRKDGWQQTGQLVAGQPVTPTVSLQANFDRPGYYTVQFGVIPPQLALDSFGEYDAVADIVWTVEGGLAVRRTVSIGNGTAVSGTGQAVKVTMRDQTSPTLGLRPYTVSAQVSPGTRPAQERPPILRGFASAQTLAAASTLILDIPANAGVISLETKLSTGVLAALPITALIQQTIGPGAVLKSYNYSPDQAFIPVNPNATRIMVTNLSAADDYELQITWGIEG